MSGQKRNLERAEAQADHWQAQLRRLPLARRLASWWARKQNVTIRAGAGKGLRFRVAGSNLAYARGTNEVPVQKALAAHLKEGDVFYDIGANVGFFTVIGARLVGKNGQVFAFEPVPANAATVRHNIDLNGFGHVRVLEKAVSSVSAEGVLQLAHYSGGASLASAAPPLDIKGTMSVELVAIDDLVAEDKLAPPSVVKIDVEGAEMDVLQGMVETIRRFKPVVIYEIDDGDWNRLRQKWTACETFLHARGYEIEHLEQSYAETGWYVENFLACPG